MRSGRLDLQVSLAVGVALVVAGVFIAVQLARNPFGVWFEPHELAFSAQELGELHNRAELRCRGAVIGHVRSVECKDPNQPFTIVAGVKREFANWSFLPNALVKTSAIQSAISPSWIELQVAPTGGIKPAPKEQHATAQIVLTLPGQEGDIHTVLAGFNNMRLRIEKILQRFDGISEDKTGATTTGESTAKTSGTPKPDAVKKQSVVDNVVKAVNELSRAMTTEVTLEQGGKTTVISKIMSDLLVTATTVHSMAVKVNAWNQDRRLETAAKDLEEAMARLKQVVDKSSGLVEQSKQTLASIRSAAARVGVASEHTADLAQRFGDTTFGRLFVKKRQPAGPESTTGSTASPTASPKPRGATPRKKP